MVHMSGRRGRPKGTGIDDSDRIARLAELLRIHPDLKPTTAIRVMGFSDPSAIRRLRDKYKAFMRAASPGMPVIASHVSPTPRTVRAPEMAIMATADRLSR